MLTKNLPEIHRKWKFGKKLLTLDNLKKQPIAMKSRDNYMSPFFKYHYKGDISIEMEFHHMRTRVGEIVNLTSSNLLLEKGRK